MVALNVRMLSAFALIVLLTLSPGCGKSDGGGKASNADVDKAGKAEAAAPAVDRSNPLIGTWTNKDAGAVFSLPDREYTATEMISHDRHWPATYQVQGNTITVAAEGLPQMTCRMIDDNTMRLTMAQGPGGTMIRYVPLRLPEKDPTEVILTALHARDYATLSAYGNNTRNDSTPAANASAVEAMRLRLADNELFNLLGHDVAWKVIGTEQASESRDSISQVKLVQIDFKSASDAPLTESGYLKQAVIKMGLNYSRSNASATDGGFSFGGARDPAKDVVWDSVPFHGLAAAVSRDARAQSRSVNSLRLIGIGGKAPFTATVVVGGEVVASTMSDGSPPPQRGAPAGWNNGQSSVVWQMQVAFDHPVTVGPTPNIINVQLADASGVVEAFSLPADSVDDFFAPSLYQNAAWKTSFISGRLGVFGNTPGDRIGQLTVVNPSELRNAIQSAGRDRADQRASVAVTGDGAMTQYQMLAYPKFWSAPVLAPADVKHMRLACAAGSDIEMQVDGQPQNAKSPNCQTSSLVRFRAVGDRPVPVAVQFFSREYSTDAEKAVFVMPAWPPVKVALSPDAQAAHDALVAMLKSHSSLAGTLVQGNQSFTINVGLTWDDGAGLALGSVDFPELKAKKKLEGFIVDDPGRSPYLQLVETGPLTVDAGSHAIVGIAYALSTDAALPGYSIIQKATYGDPATNRLIDVTDRVRSFVRLHSLNMKVNDLRAGDPAGGVVKSLVVDCTAADGSVRTASAKQGEPLVIDHVMAAPVGTLVGAWTYRAGPQYVAGTVTLKPTAAK